MLTGRRIVITGAARGLGRTLAWEVAAAGATPVMLGRDQDALNASVGAIRSATGGAPEVLAIGFDDLTGLEGAAARLAGPIDAVVHNAAAWLPGRLEEVRPEAAATALSIAVAAPLALTRALLPALQAAPSPRIVIVASRSSLDREPHPHASAAFVAAKHAQAGLADALRRELELRRIAVTSIFPPDFDDAQPDGPAACEDSRPTGRDVSAAIRYALSAPDRAPIDSIVMTRGAGHDARA